MMDLPVLRRDVIAAPALKKATVKWLGTAGFSITSAETGHVVLIDPYVTRASLARCIFGSVRPNLALVERHFPRADAIVLGHTHFDHALDAPAIAKATGAAIFGSKSASALAIASGVDPKRVHVVERAAGGEPVTHEVGPFTLRFVPSAHSPLVLGRVPFPGDIKDCEDVPVRAEQFKCGAVFAVEIAIGGKKIVHVGSAELIDTRRREADLLLLCAAGWTTSRAFPERAMSAYSPGAVLLSHWDDFFSPLDRPARQLPAMRLPSLCDRIMSANRDAALGVLPLLGEVDV